MSTAIVSIPVPGATSQQVATKHVKVSLNDDTRRFSVVDDGAKYAQLCNNVRQVYGLPAGAALLFKYKDEEGDAISLSSDAELAEAFRVAGDAALRLAVSVSAAPAPAPVAAAAPAPRCAKAGIMKAPAVAKAAAVLKAVAKQAEAAAANKEQEAPVAPMLRLAPATPAPSANANAKAADPKVEALKERNQALRERLETFKGRMAEMRAARAAGQLQVQALRRDLFFERASANPKCKAVLARGRFVCDVSVPDGSVLGAGEVFTKTWRFRNDSDAAWPAGSRLLFVGKNSDRMGAPDEVRVERAVAPGDEIDISVPLTAPNAPGRYVTYFRLCGADERKFGQRVWCSIIVKDAASSSSDEEAAAAPADADMVKFQHQLQVLAEMNLTNLRLNVRLLNKFDGNLETVVERLFARKAKLAARAAANPKAAAKEEDKVARKLAKVEAKVERKAAKIEERLAAKAEKFAAKADKKAAKAE